jgi:hypothetical protein
MIPHSETPAMQEMIERVHLLLESGKEELAAVYILRCYYGLIEPEITIAEEGIRFARDIVSYFLVKYEVFG